MRMMPIMAVVAIVGLRAIGATEQTPVDPCDRLARMSLPDTAIDTVESLATPGSTLQADRHHRSRDRLLGLASRRLER